MCHLQYQRENQILTSKMQESADANGNAWGEMSFCANSYYWVLPSPKGQSRGNISPEYRLPHSVPCCKNRPAIVPPSSIALRMGWLGRLTSQGSHSQPESCQRLLYKLDAVLLYHRKFPRQTQCRCYVSESHCVRRSVRSSGLKSTSDCTKECHAIVYSVKIWYNPLHSDQMQKKALCH